MSDPLLERLMHCSVRVIGTETGTGFFVEPGHVLTCAHVVGMERKPGDEVVVIGPDGEEAPARVLIMFADQDDDLALLAVESAGEDYVWLDDSAVLLNDVLALYGFPRGVGDTRTVNYEGRSERPGGVPGRFHHLFKAGQIIPGFSGGPLLNLRTGAVIGVVTETRGPSTDLGGNAIPASLFRQLAGDGAGYGAAPPAEAVQSWQATLKERARMIDEALTSVAGARHGRPSASIIENFIAYYRGGDGLTLFGGRRKQLDELSSWLDDPAAPYALIAAPAGRGKSALLVHWLEELASPARPAGPSKTRVVFVPVSVRYGLNTEEAVFRALVARLNDAYGVTAGGGAEGFADLRDAFSAYMRTEPPPSTRVLVVLDGLDEAAGWEVGPGVFPITPPAGVKVIVSARTQADRGEEQWLDALGWASPGNARSLKLPPLSHADVAELLRSLGAPFASRAGEEAFVGRLYHLSDGGDPLVLSLFLGDLRRDPNCLDGLADDDASPSGLERYFDRWWQQQESLWRDTHARPDAHTRNVFNLLATAFGPLPRRDLLGLARRLRPECSGDDLDETLRLLSRFVAHDADNNAYVLAHPRFAHYRYAKLRRDNEHRRYEELFLEWGRATLAAWNETPRPQEASAYIVRYYGAHLTRAGRPVEEFLARVGPGWQAAWDALKDDYNGYYADVAQSLEVAKRADRGALDAGHPLRFVGNRWRCAYALAYRTSSTESLRPEMLGSLLHHGLWSSRRCLTFIQQLDRPHRQAEALAAVLPHLQPHLMPEVERLLSQMHVEFQESVAPAVAAYCLRLWQLGERERALAYARHWQPGVARGVALATLAAQFEDRAQRSSVALESLAGLEDFDWIEFGLLIECLTKQFSRFLAPELAAPEDNEWVLPGLDANAHKEGLRLTLEGISCLSETPASLDNLVRLNDGQSLHYALPWLTRSEAASQMSRLFKVIESGELDLLGATVLIYVSSFVTHDVLEEAVRAAESLAVSRAGEENYMALALLSLTHAMPPSRGVEIARQYLSIAKDRRSFPGRDDSCGFFASLARAGLADEVLDIIRGRESEGDNSAEDLIEAVTPLLDLAQTERCLACVREFARKRRERALPVVCARLAEFGPEKARTALSILLEESSLRTRLVSSTVATLAKGTGFGSDFLGLVNAALASSEDSGVGLNALAAAVSRLDAQLSASAFSEIVRAIDENVNLATALTLIAPLLSREAALSHEVLLTYFRLPLKVGYREEPAYITSFMRRLVELGEKGTAIEFGMGLPKLINSAWLMPGAAWRAIPDPPRELVEGQFEMAEASDDPRERCRALAPLVPYTGDGPWRRSWEEGLSATIPRSCLSNYEALRIAIMLEELPGETAERVFAETFDPYFKDQAWREKFFDALVGSEIARFYPSAWFDGIRPGDIRGESSTYRNIVRGEVTVRLAKLGRAEDAFEWANGMGSYDPRVTARALDVLPVEAIPEWVDWALASVSNYDDHSPVWRALLSRLPEMSVHETSHLYDIWLDRIVKRQRSYALTELLGFLPAFERLGGTESLACILSETKD